MNDPVSVSEGRVPGEGVHGIVLAGSYQRGESPFDGLFPRPLVPVGEAPLICYALRWLREQRVSDATVCANSAARPVRDKSCSLCFSPSRSLLGCEQAARMSLRYLEDWTPRGPAGCVRDAAIRSDARTFVVVDGTTVPLVDLGGLLETHRVCRAAVTVVAHPDLGHPDLGGRGLRPSGVYVFDRRAVDHIPDAGFQDIKEGLIPRLYRAGERVVTHLAHGASPRVVSPESYLALNYWMVMRLCGQPGVPLEHRVVGEALVHEKASVAPGARLVGPVILGPFASVREDAIVVGPTSIGIGSIVGEGAIVSRSAVWEGCVVGEEALVDRCLLTDGAVVGPQDSAVGAFKLAESRNGTRTLQPRHGETLIPARLAAGLGRPSASHV